MSELPRGRFPKNSHCDWKLIHSKVKQQAERPLLGAQAVEEVPCRPGVKLTIKGDLLAALVVAEVARLEVPSLPKQG